MKFIQQNRICLTFDSVMIKIPTNLRGYKDSKSEKKIWDSYGSIGMLAKIHWEFMGIVCMKRYNSLPPTKRILKAYIQGMKMLMPELEKINISNPKHWAEDNGSLVLTNYPY